MIRDAIREALRFLLIRCVGKLVAWPVRRRIRAFEAATVDPRRVQEALLMQILRDQAETGFGKDHGFGTARTVEDYRRQVSVAGYEAIEPYIERVKKGETKALLSEPTIHMFALTSGTTATRKFIPVTPRYLETYRHGWNMWGLKAMRDHLSIRLKPIVQLAGDWQEFHTETGVPCGAVTGLTAHMQKWLIKRFYCVPASVGKIKDATAKYYAALRVSVPRKVAWLVAANPSTMINLARAGDQEKETLIRDIRDGTLSSKFDIPAEVRRDLARKCKRDPHRAKELEAIVARTGTLYPKDYWPHEFLLGNWTGGSVGAYLRHYPRYFGTQPVRDVGLIASEGRMTIPWQDATAAGILDITSHYFEFIPEAEINSPTPTILGAHEVLEGQRYYILLTTAYGLYRYHIHDLVRIAGFHNGTPLVEFLSKGSLFANMTGEKLSEYHVTQSMMQVLTEMNLTLSTYSLAPIWPDSDEQPPCYGLFIEPGEAATMGEPLVRRLEQRLCAANVEYEAKRASGRLGPIRLEVVPTGFWSQWDRERLKRNGGTMEQYKHPCLIADMDFARRLVGAA